MTVLWLTFLMAAAAPADPFARVQAAQARLEAGDFAAALGAADGLIRDYPRSPSSHLLRALALDGLQRFDDAQKAYETALAVAPKDAQILARFGMHWMQRRDWGAAIRFLEESRGMVEAGETLFYLAQAYAHTDEKARALRTIERAVELAPKNAAFLLKLGEYRAQAGQYAPALEALLAAEAVNPAEPGLDLALGVVRLGLLDVEGARTALLRAEKAQPENVAVISALAEACGKARDHAAARRYYQKLLDAGETDIRYQLGLGAALLGLGEHDAAIQALGAVVEKNPKLAEAHFHLARAYRASGRTEEAQRELKVFTALKTNPFKPFDQRAELEQGLWRRAEALLREGREAEALAVFATGNAPGNQPAFLVGALYYSFGRYDAAEVLLRRALREAPDLPKVRAYLGLTCLEQGRLSEAEELLAEESRRDPRDSFVMMALGQLAYRKKSWGEAAQRLEESRVVEPAVLLMRCEAQIESGRTEAAAETAQLVATLGDAEVWEALKRLFARRQLPLPVVAPH